MRRDFLFGIGLLASAAAGASVLFLRLIACRYGPRFASMVAPAFARISSGTPVGGRAAKIDHPDAPLHGGSRQPRKGKEHALCTD